MLGNLGDELGQELLRDAERGQRQSQAVLHKQHPPSLAARKPTAKPSIRPQAHTQNDQICERQRKAKKLFPLKLLAGWVFSLLCAKNKWEKQTNEKTA